MTMDAKDYAEKVLAIISQAWGPDTHKGFCFFPYIRRNDGSARFNEVGFAWPENREHIIDHIATCYEEDDIDLYWCPMLFEEPKRRKEYAHEEYALWADLDESNPRDIDEQWKPSVAWETSPGRYQALWLLENPEEEDLIGAAQRGADNQRMTVMVDADPSGWDITQLLRLPGWVNHKPEYSINGRQPRGKMLWSKGPRYLGEDFDSLPEVPGADIEEPDLDVFTEVVDIDRDEVMLRVRPLIPHKIRQRLEQKTLSGEDRSRTLRSIMLYYAEAGCTEAEIIAVVMPTIWNKFKGREEYLAREAAKAVAHVPKIEPWRPTPLDEYVAKQEKPKWLVKDLLVRNSVGFIAGEPKSRKSWIALDLAFSVAMNGAGHGTQFLGHYDVEHSGPVLYVALEDGGWLVKERSDKIWRFKNRTVNQGMEVKPDGTMFWSEVPSPSKLDRLNIDVLAGQPMDLSDPEDRHRLLDVISDGHELPSGERQPYTLVIIDTMMRAVGRLDMNSSTEVMAMLNPFTVYTQQPNVMTSIVFVHHFNKSQRDGDTRGGTRLMGSQAFHAWAADSLYVTATDNTITLESESKIAPSAKDTFDLDPSHRTWAPHHTKDTSAPVKNLDFAGVERPKRTRVSEAKGKILVAMRQMGPGPHRCADIAREVGMASSNCHTSLTGLLAANRVEQVDKLWRLTPRARP